MPQSHLFYQSRHPRPVLDRAEGIYMWDTSGKRYIDGSSGAMVSNIGHSNRHVLDAMRKQMEKSTFGYRLHFQTEPSEKLAAKVAALSPHGMGQVYFVSGGSEAVESTLKLARQYAVIKGQPERYKVISRMPSYHGATLGALAVTGYDPLSAPFAPMMRMMPKIPAPRAYLDGRDMSDPQTGLYYANMLEAKILEEGPETVLAFIVEPIGGASTGALVPPAGYMKRIREICDAYGVLLIHDEVMSGGGRTGKFWGAAHWDDAAPDIISIAKAFGAGYIPLGAMVARNDIVETVLDAGGFQHGHTYAGNPLACATGVAVLEVIENDHLIANAAAMGEKLIARLKSLMNRYPFIGDVRGKGLLTAFELVSDTLTMTPLPREMNAYLRLVDIAYENGLIIYSRRTRGGIEGDHFLIAPPMIVSETQIDEIMAMLTAALDQFATENGLALGSAA